MRTPLNPTTGLFVTFEGIDGCGKTTQLEACLEALTTQGIPAIATRNPGGTELGQQLRQILLHHPGFVAPTCEMLLYMADRAQHMTELVEPALTEGKVILCDRHVDSTLAYQGYGRGLPLAEIWQLNHIATQHRLPDLTLLFDGPVEVLAQRVSKRGEADRLERETANFREKVRQGYLALAQAEPERIQVLDATQSIEALKPQVLQRLYQYLNKH